MESIFSLSPWVMAVVPIVMALVELVKKQGLSERYAPIASLLLGIGLVFLASDKLQITSWSEGAIQGILAGLLASGLYSGGRATVRK